jgi:hypothetical protein
VRLPRHGRRGRDQKSVIGWLTAGEESRKQRAGDSSAERELDAWKIPEADEPVLVSAEAERCAACRDQSERDNDPAEEP